MHERLTVSGSVKRAFTQSPDEILVRIGDYKTHTISSNELDTLVDGNILTNMVAFARMRDADHMNPEQLKPAAGHPHGGDVTLIFPPICAA